jgi:hypothetical protein
MQQLNENQTINTNLTLNVPEMDHQLNDQDILVDANLSPIYSRVFKSKLLDKSVLEEMNEEKSTLNDYGLTENEQDYGQAHRDDNRIQTDNDETLSQKEEDEMLIETKKIDLNAYSTNNYMYLMNAEDCDQTFESQTIQDSESHINKASNNRSKTDDEKTKPEDHYFMPNY